jgi:condensin complex subunit 1
MSASKDAIEALANSSENITDPKVFDVYRSYLKCAKFCVASDSEHLLSHRHSGSLQGNIMNKLLDSISSSLSGEIEAATRDMDSDDHHVLTTHKTPLEMYAFLINWISSAAEAVKTPGEEGAAASKPKVRLSFQLLLSSTEGSSRKDAHPRPPRRREAQKRKTPGAGRIKSLRHWLF